MTKGITKCSFVARWASEKVHFVITLCHLYVLLQSHKLSFKQFFAVFLDLVQ